MKSNNMGLWYALLPHDIDAYFYDRDLMPELFCKTCGARIGKDCRRTPMRIGRKLLIGMTYDGVVLMSPDIARLLHEKSGAKIQSVDTNFGEYFYFNTLEDIDVDLAFRPVQFENECSVCGVFGEVSHALPLRLMNDSSMSPTAVKQTSVQFGVSRHRAPIVIIGADLHCALQQIRPKGLEVVEVHSSATKRWW
jgi:hypothetical protein